MSSLRDNLIIQLGPGLFGGTTLGHWMKLLWANGFSIAPQCMLRAGAITAISAATTACSYYESLRYSAKVRDVEVQPPIFVLGHWRSGTTHLHNLMCVDKRFAYPNFYQVLYPHSFLSTESTITKMFKAIVPEKRFVDNVKLAFDVPYEDEFALCVSTHFSNYTSMAFPHAEEENNRYLTMRDVPAEELAQWRAALMLFLKKLTWKYQKPLVLKSPSHTCRIKLLLEMFPDAKFIHIHREPYSVFRSTRGLITGWDRWHRLQVRDFAALDDYLIRRYKELYDVFFEERSLIPEGQFHELSYEALDADPYGEIEKAYAQLNLPDFNGVKADMQAYVNGISNYQKNSHPDLEPELRATIAQAWQRSFEEWDYAA
ncbi:sulfotransferase [Symmachiella dynata]|uniref:sulfotransferase family protein n=1 Tax=Symmachiella dynata TaxID=2527995 RepID=UPI0030EDB9E7